MERYFNRLFLCVVSFATVSAGGIATMQTAAKDPLYKYTRTGNERDALAANLQGGFAMIGGGKDLDEAFVWMCQHSGGGDFLIVRAAGTDAYNPYVNSLCKQNSVATLIIPSREAANDPAVGQKIREAEALFVAGGDQSNYINFWKGTPVQIALNDAILRGVPIGGTSAGLAVLGEFIYSAQNDPPSGPNLTSRDALADPFHKQITVVRDFLHIAPLQGVITDSHFSSRDRLGRTLVFLARILQSGDAQPARGIGIDEHTAVLLDPPGSSRIAGTGAAYFLAAGGRASIMEAGKPLTIQAISAVKEIAGGKFDLSKWSGDGTAYTLSIENGVIRSTKSDGSAY